MTISTYMIGLNELQIFTVYTLVDITNTGVTRYSEKFAKQRNQQRNWETVLQAFALRSLPIVIEPPTLNKADTIATNFGTDYLQNHSIWTAKIGIEALDVYKKGNDVTALLLEDFNQVPIIVGLDETANFPHNAFSCAGATKNIYFIIE